MEDYIQELNCYITRPIDIKKSIQVMVDLEMRDKKAIEQIKQMDEEDKNKRKRVNSILDLEI
jgi:hypothetical protein